jgi:hypothetical protein
LAISKYLDTGLRDGCNQREQRPKEQREQARATAQQCGDDGGDNAGSFLVHDFVLVSGNAVLDRL